MKSGQVLALRSISRSAIAFTATVIDTTCAVFAWFDQYLSRPFHLFASTGHGHSAVDCAIPAVDTMSKNSTLSPTCFASFPSCKESLALFYEILLFAKFCVRPNTDLIIAVDSRQ